jgi:nitroreductase
MKRIIAIVATVLAGAVMFGQDISLPAPKDKIGLDLADAIKARATSRSFVAKDVPVADLSTILWAGNGRRSVDAVSSASKAGRNIAYSGDVPYLNVYVFTAQGAYLYVPEKNLLKQVAKKDVRAQVTPEFIKTSPVLILFAVDLAKAPAFLKGNAALLESVATGTAGSAAENVSLAASSLKLSSIIMYNINTAAIPALASFGKEEKPLSIMQLGYAP